MFAAHWAYPCVSARLGEGLPGKCTHWDVPQLVQVLTVASCVFGSFMPFSVRRFHPGGQYSLRCSGVNLAKPLGDAGLASTSPDGLPPGAQSLRATKLL